MAHELIKSRIRPLQSSVRADDKHSLRNMIYSVVKHRVYIAHDLAAVLLKLLLPVAAPFPRKNGKTYPHHKAYNAHIQIERGQNQDHHTIDGKENSHVYPCG